MHGIRPALLALLVLTSGCYTWHDVSREAVAPGTDLRVTLEREVALQRIEDAGELRLTVSGTATEQTDASSLGLTTRLRGSTFNSFEALPWSGIVRIEEKRFSWLRTGGMAALGAGATIAILSVLEGQTDEGSEGPPINESGVVRVPLFTIGR
jgi:hypothetical protein